MDEQKKLRVAPSIVSVKDMYSTGARGRTEADRMVRVASPAQRKAAEEEERRRSLTGFLALLFMICSAIWAVVFVVMGTGLSHARDVKTTLPAERAPATMIEPSGRGFAGQPLEDNSIGAVGPTLLGDARAHAGPVGAARNTAIPAPLVSRATVTVH